MTLSGGSKEAAVGSRGRYGAFGGQYVPETLMAPLEELESAYDAAKADPAFQNRLAALLRDFAGRPTPLFRGGKFVEAPRRSGDLPEARRFAAYRRAQNQ